MGEAIRWITGPIGLVCIVSLLVTQCNKGSYEDDIERDKASIGLNEAIMEEAKNNIKHRRELLVILNKYDQVDSSSGHVHTDKYSTVALGEIASIEYDVRNVEEEIEELASNESRDLHMIEVNEEIFGYGWKAAIVFSFIFFITLPNYSNSWEKYKAKKRMQALEKPEKIFVVSLVNGKYKLVYRKGWWTAEPGKEYKTSVDAIAYVDALKNEMFEKNWHKIMG